MENLQIKYNIDKKLNILISHRKLNVDRTLIKRRYYIYIKTLINNLKLINQYFYNVQEKLSSFDNLFFVE